MYIISGVDCILGLIFGVLVFAIDGLIGFLGGAIFGLLWLLPYLLLTILWGVGFCSKGPCLKISYGILFLIIQLVLGGLILVGFVFSLAGLIILEIVHVAFVICMTVGIFMVVAQERREVEAMNVVHQYTPLQQ